MNATHGVNEYHDNSNDGGHHKRSVDSVDSHAADTHADPYGDHGGGHGYVFQVWIYFHTPTEIQMLN